MSASKVAIIVLVVLAVAFVVLIGVGRGNSRKDEPDGKRRPWLELLGSWMVPKHSDIALERIEPECGKEGPQDRTFLIASQAACSVTIAAVERVPRGKLSLPNSMNVAYLKLRFASGVRVSVLYEPADEDSDEDPQSLRTGENLLVPVFKGGGTLTFNCVLGPCALEVQ